MEEKEKKLKVSVRPRRPQRDDVLPTSDAYTYTYIDKRDSNSYIYTERVLPHARSRHRYQWEAAACHPVILPWHKERCYTVEDTCVIGALIFVNHFKKFVKNLSFFYEILYLPRFVIWNLENSSISREYERAWGKN